MLLEIYDSGNLNFVELNFTGDNTTFIRCDKESKYIDSAVFNFFAPCFEKANKLYEYFGPTKFNSRKIIPLRNELVNNGEVLENINTNTDFLDYINGTFLGPEFLEQLEKEHIKFEKSWEEILSKLLKINNELISLIEFCADEERILWVAGY